MCVKSVAKSRNTNTTTNCGVLRGLSQHAGMLDRNPENVSVSEMQSPGLRSKVINFIQFNGRDLAYILKENY